MEYKEADRKHPIRTGKKMILLVASGTTSSVPTISSWKFQEKTEIENL